MQTKEQMTKSEEPLHFATKAIATSAAMTQSNDNAPELHLSYLQSKAALTPHSLPRLLLPQQFTFSPLYFDTHAINTMYHNVESVNSNGKTNNSDNKTTSNFANDKNDNRHLEITKNNNINECKSNLMISKGSNDKELIKSIDSVKKTGSDDIHSKDCNQSKAAVQYTNYNNDRRLSIDGKEENQNTCKVERGFANKDNNNNNNVSDIYDSIHNDDLNNSNNNIITDNEEVFYQHFIYGQSHPPPTLQREQPAFLVHNNNNNSKKMNSKVNYNYVSNANSALFTNNNTPSFSEVSPLPYFREEQNVPAHINISKNYHNNSNTGVMRRLENTPLWREKEKPHTKTSVVHKEKQYNVSSVARHSNSLWQNNNNNNYAISSATSPPVTRSFVLRQQQAQRREDQRRALAEAAAAAEEELRNAQALGQMSKIWHRNDNENNNITVTNNNDDNEENGSHTNANAKEKEEAAFINTPPSISLLRPTRSTLLRASFTTQQLQRLQEKNTLYNHKYDYHTHRPAARRAQSADVVKARVSSLSASSLPRTSRTNEENKNDERKLNKSNENDVDEVHEIYSRNTSNNSNFINIDRNSVLENVIVNIVNTENNNQKDVNVINKNSDSVNGKAKELTTTNNNNSNIDSTAATKSTLLRKLYNEQRLSEMEKIKKEMQEDENFWQDYRDGKLSPRRRSMSKCENSINYNEYHERDKSANEVIKYMISRRGKSESVMSAREPEMKMSVTRRSAHEHVSPSRTTRKVINKVTITKEENNDGQLTNPKQNELSTLQGLEKSKQELEQLHKNVNRSNTNSDDQDHLHNVIDNAETSTVANEINTYNKGNRMGAIHEIYYDAINNIKDNNSSSESIPLNRTARLRQEYITAKENEWKAEMEEETAKRNAILLRPSPVRHKRHFHPHEQSLSLSSQIINDADKSHIMQKESQLPSQRENISMTPRMETKSAVLRKQYNTKQRKQQQEQKEQKENYHHHKHDKRDKKVKEQKYLRDSGHLTPRHVEKEQQNINQTTQNDKNGDKIANNDDSDDDDDDIHFTIEENEAVSVSKHDNITADVNNDKNAKNKEEIVKQEQCLQETFADRKADIVSDNCIINNEQNEIKATVKVNMMIAENKANICNAKMINSKDEKQFESLSQEREHCNKEFECTKTTHNSNAIPLTDTTTEAKNQECMKTLLPQTNMVHKMNEGMPDMNAYSQKVVAANAEVDAKAAGVKLSPTQPAPLSTLPLLSAHKVQHEEQQQQEEQTPKSKHLHKNANECNKTHSTHTNKVKSKADANVTTNTNTDLCKLNDDIIQNVDKYNRETEHNSDKTCSTTERKNAFSDESVAITKAAHSVKNDQAVLRSEQQTLQLRENKNIVQSCKSIELHNNNNSETSVNDTGKATSSRQKKTRRRKISALTLVYMFEMQCNSNNKCYERYFHHWIRYAATKKLVNHKPVEQITKEQQQELQQQQSKTNDTFPVHNNIIGDYVSENNSNNNSNERTNNSNDKNNNFKDNSVLTHQQESKERHLAEKKMEHKSDKQETHAVTGNNKLFPETPKPTIHPTLLPSPSPSPSITSLLHVDDGKTVMKHDTVPHTHERQHQVKETTRSSALSSSPSSLSPSSTLPLTSSSHLSSASFLSTRLPSHQAQMSKLSVATLTDSKVNMDKNNNNKSNKEGEVIATTPLQRWRERQRHSEVNTIPQLQEENEQTTKEKTSSVQSTQLSPHSLSTLSHRVRSSTTQNSKSDKINSIYNKEETFVNSASKNPSENNNNNNNKTSQETNTFTQTGSEISNDKENVMSNSNNHNAISIETTPSDLTSTPFLTEVAKVNDDICNDITSEIMMKEKESRQSDTTQVKINTNDKGKVQNNVDEHINKFDSDQHEKVTVSNIHDTKNSKKWTQLQNANNLKSPADILNMTVMHASSSSSLLVTCQEPLIETSKLSRECLDVENVVNTDEEFSNHNRNNDDKNRRRGVVDEKTNNANTETQTLCTSVEHNSISTEQEAHLLYSNKANFTNSNKTFHVGESVHSDKEKEHKKENTVYQSLPYSCSTDETLNNKINTTTVETDKQENCDYGDNNKQQVKTSNKLQFPEDKEQTKNINQSTMECRHRTLESSEATDVSNVTNNIIELNNEKSNNPDIINTHSNTINKEIIVDTPHNEEREQCKEQNRDSNGVCGEGTSQKQSKNQEYIIEVEQKKRSINDKDLLNNIISYDNANKDVSKSESHRNSYLSTFSYSGGTIEEIEQEVPDVLEVNLAAEMIEEEISNELKLEQRVRAQAPTPRMSVYSDTEDKNEDSVYSMSNRNSNNNNNDSSNNSNLSANYNSSDPFDNTDVMSEFDSFTNIQHNTYCPKLTHQYEQEQEEKREKGEEELPVSEEHQQERHTSHLHNTNDSEYLNDYNIEGNTYMYENNKDVQSKEREPNQEFVNNEHEKLENATNNCSSDAHDNNTNKCSISSNCRNNSDPKEPSCTNTRDEKEIVLDERTVHENNNLNKIKENVKFTKETELQESELEREEIAMTKANEHHTKATNRHNSKERRDVTGNVVNTTVDSHFTPNKNVHDSCSNNNHDHHNNTNDDGSAFLFEVITSQTTKSASELQRRNVIENNEFDCERANNKYNAVHHATSNPNSSDNICENECVNNDNNNNYEMSMMNDNNKKEGDIRCKYIKDNIHDNVNAVDINVCHTVLNGSEAHIQNTLHPVSLDTEAENDICNENKVCLVAHRDRESLQKQECTKRNSDALDKESFDNQTEGNNNSNILNDDYVNTTKMNDKSKFYEHTKRNALTLNENMNNVNINSFANKVNSVKDRKTATTSMTINVANTDFNNYDNNSNTFINNDKQLNHVNCTPIVQPQLPLSSITSSPLFSPCTLKMEQQQQEQKEKLYIEEPLRQQSYNVNHMVPGTFSLTLEQQRPQSPIPLTLERTNAMESSQRTEECYWSATGSPLGSDNDEDNVHNAGVKVVPVIKAIPAVIIVGNRNTSECNNTSEQQNNNIVGVDVAVSANTADDVNKLIGNNVVKYNCDSIINTHSDNSNNNDDKEDEVIVTYIHHTHLTNVHSLESTQVQKEKEQEHQHELLHKQQEQEMPSCLRDYDENSWSSRADSEDLHSINSLDTSVKNIDVE